MLLKQYLISTILALSIPARLVGAIDLLPNDAAALSYCKTNKESYIAIIWPRGLHESDYIKKTLGSCAHVRYIKTFHLTKHGAFLFYRYLHQSISFKGAQRYFKPYIPRAADEPIELIAIAFDTQEPLAQIQCWKAEMRKEIGNSFFSLHINDFHKQTVEAATVLFRKPYLQMLNNLPHANNFTLE